MKFNPLFTSLVLCNNISSLSYVISIDYLVCAQWNCCNWVIDVAVVAVWQQPCLTTNTKIDIAISLHNNLLKRAEKGFTACAMCYWHLFCGRLSNQIPGFGLAFRSIALMVMARVKIVSRGNIVACLLKSSKKHLSIMNIL